VTATQQGERSRGRRARDDEDDDEQQGPTDDEQQGDDGEQDDEEQDDKRGGRNRPQSGGRSSLVKNKHIIEEFIDVGVPHQVAYDQWTQSDEWSTIFKKESAKAEGDESEKVTVTAKIGPSQRQWPTEVLFQKPGRRIEWQAKGGVKAKGVTTFHRLDERLTHVQAVIQYQPSGFFETIGNFFRMQRRRVRKDLKLFKNFIDLRGEATGEGPGEITGSGLVEGVDEQIEQAHREREEKEQDEQEQDDDQGQDDQDDESEEGEQ
jgi:uncharacterized membrane protein